MVSCSFWNFSSAHLAQEPSKLDFKKENSTILYRRRLSGLPWTFVHSALKGVMPLRPPSSSKEGPQGWPRQWTVDPFER